MGNRNPKAKTMTYDQAADRKDRGVAGLERMGNDEAADDLDSESVESFAERKHITLENAGQGKAFTFHGAFKSKEEARRKERQVGGFIETRKIDGEDRYIVMKERKSPNPPRRTGKSVQQERRRSRKNQHEGDTVTVGDAAKLYEEFHGEPPHEILTIMQRESRKNFTGLGKLVSLDLDAWGIVDFSADDGVIVASDPEGKQIYFLGGNQDLDEAIQYLKVPGAEKDFVNLGEVMEITYTTKKGFDGFEEIDYYHKFGEEDEAAGEPVRRPTLMFARLLRRMYLVGGGYQIKPEGITN